MGFVFTNELGRVIDDSQLRKHYKRFVREAGIKKANVHATCHTFDDRMRSVMDMMSDRKFFVSTLGGTNHFFRLKNGKEKSLNLTAKRFLMIFVFFIES